MSARSAVTSLTDLRQNRAYLTATPATNVVIAADNTSRSNDRLTVKSAATVAAGVISRNAAVNRVDANAVRRADERCRRLPVRSVPSTRSRTVLKRCTSVSCCQSILYHRSVLCSVTYFLRSCPLPNLISILSPITIQFVFDVFVLYVLCNFYCTALLCYLVL